MLRYIVVLCCAFAASAAAQVSVRLGDAPVVRPSEVAPSGAAKFGAERSASAPAAVPSTWYDISTRSAAQAAYFNDYVPTTAVPLGFTGNVTTGQAGDTSAAYKTAMIQRFNFFRAMAGVPGNVTLNSTLNSRAQQGALMMAANGAITHTPPTNWKYWTQTGSDALSSSNVCQGFISDPGCVEQFIADQGSNNAAVGHRRWMFYTRLKQIGTGDVPYAGNLWNATYVIDRNSEGYWLGASTPTRDGFVAWPPKGYVPYQLNFPRWSFSLPGYPGPDFSAAVVKVTKNNVTTTVPLEPLSNNATQWGESFAGDNTIVFNPDNRSTTSSSYVPTAPASDTTYRVSVENVRINGATQPPYVYDVIVFNPAVTPGSNCSPSVSSVNAQPGYQNVTINVSGAGCGAWSASSGTSWAALFPLSGSGAGSTTLTLYPNFTSSTRQTTVTVAGQPVTIVQPSMGGTADERFVGQVYFFFLGRMASPAEVAFQVQNGLGAGRASLAYAFLNSAEFNTYGRFVAGLYVGLLNRDPEFGGWQFQRNALLQGIVSQDQLVSNFLNTAEYQLKYPNQSNEAFVRMLYQQVMLRNATQGEVDFQVSALNSGTSRTTMAKLFLTFPEFQNGRGARLLAFLYYATLLNRDPSSGELAAMTTALSSASPAQQQALMGQILASPEYQALLQ